GLPRLRLAPDPPGAARIGRGRGVQDRGLHERIAHRRGFAVHRPDGRPGRGDERRRVRDHRDHPRRDRPPGAVGAVEAVRRRRARRRGRFAGAGAAGARRQARTAGQRGGAGGGRCRRRGRRAAQRLARGGRGGGRRRLADDRPLSRQGRRNRARLRRSRLRLGDAIVFQGEADSIHESLAALGCLPLAERQLRLGRPRQLVVPLLILAAAMVVTGLELVPVAIAFVAAALALVVFGLLPVHEAYRAIDWRILILLGALIPIGEAVQTTGTAELIAHVLAGLAAHVPAFAVLAALLAVTMLVTPILHHAAAVLVMGPIAASLAQLLGYRIDPFLIAVALGAGSDFLSPIGHQCNTLVMGPGGYRFGDYWKLGLPLSLLVVVLGVPLI